MKELLILSIIFATGVANAGLADMFPDDPEWFVCAHNWDEQKRLNPELELVIGPIYGCLDPPHCLRVGVGIGFADLSQSSCVITLKKIPSSASAPSSANDSCKPQIESGSLIDYDLKTVSESVPIVGTNLELSYHSGYNPKSLVNNRIQVDIAKILYSGTLIPTLKFYVWPVGDTSNTLTVPVDLGMRGFRFSYQSTNNSGLLYSDDFKSKLSVRFKVEQGFTCLVWSYPDCLQPIDFNLDIFDEPATKTVYKPEVFGLKGWTLSNHHYFAKDSLQLFKGTGQILQYTSIKTVSLPEYGVVDLVIEKNAGQEIYIFDQLGRHLETRQALMGVSIYKFQYNSNSKITSITDQFNKQTQFIYNGNQDIAKIIAPFGQETNVTVFNNSISEVKDPLNQSYFMQYDAGKQLTSFTSVSGVETQFSYNEVGEFLAETKNTGVVKTFFENFTNALKEQIYKMNFGIVKKFEVGPLNSNFSSLTEYDSENRKVFEKVYSAVNRAEIYIYDNSSVSKMFPATPEWFTDYAPAANRQTFITESNQNIVQNEHIVEQRVYLNSQNPLTLNNYFTETFVANRRTNFTSYNPATRVLFSTDDRVSSQTQFNDKGQITQISPSTAAPVNFDYNAQGQLIKAQKGSHFEAFTYDNNGHLASSTNSKNQSTLFNYDIGGNLLQKTLPNGDLIKFEYSAGSEIKKIVAPNNQVHNFQLSLGDYLQRYFTPNNMQTAHNYDVDKRLTQTVKPSGKTIDYNYKAQSANLDSIGTPDGNININSIDARGRLRSITSTDNIKTDINWAHTKIQEQSWFDSDGSLIGKLSFNYKFHEIKLDNIKLNDQQIVKYEYNNFGQVSDINNQVSYQYTTAATTERININFGALSCSYAYEDADSGDKPTQVVSGRMLDNPAAQTFITMFRAFDNFGQSSEFTQTVLNANTGVYNSYYSLIPNYDANNRLTEISKNRKSFLNDQEINSTDFQNQYTYPPQSNNNFKEFKQTLNNAQLKRTIATHNNDDQLLTLRGSINRTYTYTDDGDLQTMSNCYGSSEYFYDVFGNLKKVILPDGKIIEYKVDGLNRRVKKLVNGVTQEYYLWYDQIHLAAILDQNKIPKLTYIYGPESSSPSYVIKNGVTHKILHDPGLGSVRFIVNPVTQQIVQEIEYDEFGNVMKNTNPDFQPLTYAGGLYDSDTKLIRFGARDYDPTIGRWTTKDPIGFAGGDTNLYAYVGGNPMSYYDPLGLWSVGAGGYLGLGGGITFGQNPDNKWFVDIQLGAGVGAGAFYNKLGTSPDWGNSNGINGGPALAVGGFFDAGLNFGPLGAGYSRNAGQTFTGLNRPTEGYNSGGFYGGLSPTMKLGAGVSTGAQFCVRP